MAVFVTLVPKDMGEELVPMLVALGAGVATYVPLAHLSDGTAPDNIEMISTLIRATRSKINSKRNQG